MFKYDSNAADRAHMRHYRARLDLSRSPHIAEIEAAGARMGLHCRADASEAIRRYIWRKQCALVQHIAARDSWRPIVWGGHELPLSMGAYRNA